MKGAHHKRVCFLCGWRERCSERTCRDMPSWASTCRECEEEEMEMEMWKGQSVPCPWDERWP